MSLSKQIQESLKVALLKREALRQRTNAIRLVNGIGDRLEGLVVEQYNKHFVAQIFNSIWMKEASSLKEFLMDLFEVDYFIVKDRSQNTSSNTEHINVNVLVENTNSRTLVRENNLIFEVDLNDTLNTGLFLDMRSNRLLVGKACLGKRVLNCFSYTCSFGVYAKAFGAVEVVNVDVSKKILEKGMRNYELNQIEARSNGWIKADAVEYLEKAVKKDNRFDVIVLDPPSFARAGNKVFSVEKDLSKLIQLGSSILNKDGKLFVSTNLSQISSAKLEQLVRTHSVEKKFKQIISLGQDQDFIGSGQAKESHLAAVWVEF